MMGLNQRPAPYQDAALPAELIVHCHVCYYTLNNIICQINHIEIYSQDLSKILYHLHPSLQCPADNRSGDKSTLQYGGQYSTLASHWNLLLTLLQPEYL